MATKPAKTVTAANTAAPAVDPVATPETALAAAVVQGAQNPDGTAHVASAGLPGAFVPKIAKILTLPLLKMKEGEPIYVKFTGKIFTGKQIQEELDKIAKNAELVAAGKAPEPVKAPPEMANVVNLATGELVQIMLGKVLCGIFQDEYPGDAYIGKGFVIQLTEKKRGRSGGNYNTYKVAELEL